MAVPASQPGAKGGMAAKFAAGVKGSASAGTAAVGGEPLHDVMSRTQRDMLLKVHAVPAAGPGSVQRVQTLRPRRLCCLGGSAVVGSTREEDANNAPTLPAPCLPPRTSCMSLAITHALNATRPWRWRSARPSCSRRACTRCG